MGGCEWAFPVELMLTMNPPAPQRLFASTKGNITLGPSSRMYRLKSQHVHRHTHARTHAQCPRCCQSGRAATEMIVLRRTCDGTAACSRSLFPPPPVRCYHGCRIMFEYARRKRRRCGTNSGPTSDGVDVDGVVVLRLMRTPD